MKPYLILICGVSVVGISGCVSAPQAVPIAASYNVTFEGHYINVADVDVKPVPVYMKRPVYPAALRAAGIGGFAITELVVSTSGTPAQVQVVRASDEAFARAAIEAMEQWRFSVAKKDGVPVACREQIPIEFELTN